MASTSGGGYVAKCGIKQQPTAHIAHPEQIAQHTAFCIQGWFRIDFAYVISSSSSSFFLNTDSCLSYLSYLSCLSCLSVSAFVYIIYYLCLCK